MQYNGAVDLRRYRRQAKLTQTEVAVAAGVDVSYVSLIEKGVRTPTPEVLARLKNAIGITEVLPFEMVGRSRLGASAATVAAFGACLIEKRQVELTSLAQATGLTVREVRRVLRRLSDGLAPAGMLVVDDGTMAMLVAMPAYTDALEALSPIPMQDTFLTPVQAQVASIVILLGVATNRKISKFRGADSQEALDSMVELELLAVATDNYGTGNVALYRPTARLLAAHGCETLEEARQKAKGQVSSY